MRCPFCNFEDTKVIDSRPADAKKRRRRECTNCGKRFTTYESVEMPVLFVLKRDGSLEIFDRNKLLHGVSSAVKKRKISTTDINKIIDEIECYCANNMISQISTTEIGDIVLNSLKKIDLVAYVRFASVYKDFNDVESFIEIISQLNNEKKD